MNLQGYFSFVLSDVLLNVGINRERKPSWGPTNKEFCFNPCETEVY